MPRGCSGHIICAHPASCTHLLTLHQHRANNQYRTANQIKPTLRVSIIIQTTLEQSPIQILSELNVAWLQWSYENWHFQVDKPLHPSIWLCRYKIPGTIRTLTNECFFHSLPHCCIINSGRCVYTVLCSILYRSWNWSDFSVVPFLSWSAKSGALFARSWYLNPFSCFSYQAVSMGYKMNMQWPSSKPIGVAFDS